MNYTHVPARVPLASLRVYHTCRFEATVRTDVTSSLRTRQEVLNREPDLAKLMLWVYGGTDWLYPDSAPGPLSGGQAPPLRMRRVPVQQLKMQLAGAALSPGFVGSVADGRRAGGSGVGTSVPGLGSLPGVQNVEALKGQFVGKMKKLKGFAKGLFN
jgi:hypothetical protein